MSFRKAGHGAMNVQLPPLCTRIIVFTHSHTHTHRLVLTVFDEFTERTIVCMGRDVCGLFMAEYCI